MKVLALDSGAKRMGWASLRDENGKLSYHMSGIIHFPVYSGTKFQAHRLDLAASLTESLPTLFDLTECDTVVNETLPAQGFNNSSQSYLVNVAISTVHALAFQRQLRVSQISANTVKKMVGGDGSASKVKVRDGVFKAFPELIERKKDWVTTKKMMDEPDAIGVGLAFLGFQVKNVL